MKIKLLQLNMWAGMKWEILSDFLKKSDFDILSLQEVAGPQTYGGNVHCDMDCFDKLQELLGTNYAGQLTKTTVFTSNPQTSYEGNAIFYKKDFTLITKNILSLYKGMEPFPSDATTFEEESRDALHLTLEKDDKTLQVISTHLAWAPTQYEQPYQRKQNLKLIDYVKNLPTPWILTGDFNISTNEPSILDLEKYGRDLTKEFRVTNTIDPVNHVSWEKLQPGFPIDYIFVSPDVNVHNFQTLENIHLSDHIGLTALIEI